MKSNNRIIRLLWSFGVSSLFFIHLTAAQQKSQTAAVPAAQEAPVVPAEPVPIPASDILSRADEVTADLRRVEALLEPTNEVETIKSAIDEQKDVLVALHSELDGLDPDTVSTRVLEDHRLKWVKFQTRVDEWMSDLQKRWRALQVERQNLGRTRLQWEATREIATSETVSPELHQRIDTILERLFEVQGRIRQRSDAVAAVIERVSRGGEVTAEALEKVDAMAAEVRGRWLSRDEPPLWEVAPLSERSTIWHDAREAQQYWYATVVEFVGERQERFNALLALFAVYLLVALFLRRWSRSWPAHDHAFDAARFVLSRPVSAALAFTIISMIYVVGETPGPVRDLVGVVAVVPVIRLGVGLVPATARPLLYGAVTLFLLNRLWEIAPDGSLLRRLLLSLVTTLALVGAVLLIRHWRAATDMKETRWRRVAMAGLYLAAVLLAASLLAGVLGWSTFAQLLTEATIESAYAGVAWWVVAKVLIGLSGLAPRGAIGRLFLSISRYERQFNRIAVFLITAFVLFRWGLSTLQYFQILEPVRQWITAGLSTPLARGTLDISLGNVSAAVVILVSTYLVARFVRFVLREEVFRRLRLSAGAAHSVATLVNYTVIAFGIILAAATLGFTGTQLTVVFGALGVGIGFGLQTVVANFVSGLILIFERPIKVGDRVQTVDHFGIVTDIGIRASTIRTFDGAEVVVPNSDLVSKEVINWTRSDQVRRVEVLLRVALGTDPKKVLAILRKVADDHPLVFENPEPSSWMTGFGESSLDFRLFAWTQVENFLVVSSDLHVAVNEAIREAGIEIPVPKRDLQVRAADQTSTPFEPKSEPEA